MFGLGKSKKSDVEKEIRVHELLLIEGVKQGLLTGMATPMVMMEIQEAKKILQELGRI